VSKIAARRGIAWRRTLRDVPQIHLRAEAGDYAPLILLPGDPNRARRIAESFDGGVEAARLVNDHRGLLGWTGTYRGSPVSVQTTGMGTPSFSIVAEELLRLGAQQLIRVGTCGGIGEGIRTGDIVIAMAACPLDGATRTYLHGDPFAPTADWRLTHALHHAAEGAGLTAHLGTVASVDVFYNTDPDYASKWRARGVLAFEMEASALFLLAARERVQAGCVLTVSDVLSEDVTPEETYLSPDALGAAVDTMIEVALAAAVAAGREVEEPKQ
jgi:DeoD family purine-nucleoside phosphorylase